MAASGRNAAAELRRWAGQIRRDDRRPRRVRSDVDVRWLERLLVSRQAGDRGARRRRRRGRGDRRRGGQRAGAGMSARRPAPIAAADTTCSPRRTSMHACHDHDRHSIFCILPPHVLEAIAKEGDAEHREWALQTLSVDTTIRSERVTEAVAACRRRPARSGAQAAGHLQRQSRVDATGDACPVGRPGRVGRRRDRRGLRRPRRHVRSLLERLRPPLDRRRRAAPARHRPLRHELRQRLLERPADGVRRRRRRALQPVHDRHRRHRARAHPRRHRGRQPAWSTTIQPGALNESISDVFGSLVKQYAQPSRPRPRPTG